MSLVVGQRMVRTDDGMRGVVELVTVPGYDLEEKRIVYFDRGESRLAGKREVWEVEKTPPRKLRTEERLKVAVAADRMLLALERNEPHKWWDWNSLTSIRDLHDPELVRLIDDYLAKRG